MGLASSFSPHHAGTISPRIGSRTLLLLCEMIFKNAKNGGNNNPDCVDKSTALSQSLQSTNEKIHVFSIHRTDENADWHHSNGLRNRRKAKNGSMSNDLCLIYGLIEGIKLHGRLKHLFVKNLFSLQNVFTSLRRDEHQLS